MIHDIKTLPGVLACMSDIVATDAQAQFMGLSEPVEALRVASKLIKELMDVQKDEERMAWDQYMASALKEGVSAKRAAEWADAALVERKNRFKNVA